ncbi:MAG: ABC transporter ATP-binding protein [Candidatus Saccharibacteria bacterium]|nr:ABC transporter ATP-binding protein [Candidatus Saccharibacteria bacterium]
MTRSNSIIEVKNLVKKFGSFTALDGLNLSVKQGEVHGFLGPNGSGKSTTIRVLLGLLKKTGGEVSLLGKDPWEDAVKLHEDIAYVPGDTSLWPTLSGGEAIDVLGALRGGINRKKRDEYIKRFQLDPRKKFRTYSKGNRQKVALVAALSSDADVFIMDEPTAGLDPLMEAVFQTCVNELKQQGKTVLLSSHILAEVEALCDRVTIIREGKTVETGTLGELQHLHRTTIKVEATTKITGLSEQKGVHNLRTKGNHAEFEVESDRIDAVLDTLAKQKIKALRSHPPTLEELFLKHYDDGEK